MILASISVALEEGDTLRDNVVDYALVFGSVFVGRLSCLVEEAHYDTYPISQVTEPFPWCRPIE